MIQELMEAKERKLEELLNKDLIESPPSMHESIGLLSNICNFSFESLIAMSTDLLDYRILVFECWRRMQCSMNISNKGDTHNALGILIVLAVKFPSYFNFQSLQSIVFNILPQKLPQNANEELHRRANYYLRNYHTIIRSTDLKYCDFVRYYSSTACAVRETGVCEKLVSTAQLFFEFCNLENNSEF